MVRIVFFGLKLSDTGADGMSGYFAARMSLALRCTASEVSMYCCCVCISVSRSCESAAVWSPTTVGRWSRLTFSLAEDANAGGLFIWKYAVTHSAMLSVSSITHQYLLSRQR